MPGLDLQGINLPNNKEQPVGQKLRAYGLKPGYGGSVVIDEEAIRWLLAQ